EARIRRPGPDRLPVRGPVRPLRSAAPIAALRRCDAFGGSQAARQGLRRGVAAAQSMKRVRFAKMHGAGNDFTVVDCLAGDPVESWPQFARFALDRHFGIGGDQLLLVRPSARADFRMDIYNADGSRAEMCANGIRAFAKYVRDRGLARGDRITVETLAGVVAPRWIS